MAPELRAPTLHDLPELVAFFEGLRERYGEHAMTEGQLRDNLTSKRWKPEENYRVALVDGRIAGWSSLWSPEDQPERIFLNLRVAGRELPLYCPLLDWAEQRATEIACDGADVSALAAIGFDDRAVPFMVDQGQAVDFHRARLQLHHFSVARKIIGALPLNLDGGETWRHLLHLAGEAGQE